MKGFDISSWQYADNETVAGVSVDGDQFLGL